VVVGEASSSAELVIQCKGFSIIMRLRFSRHQTTTSSVEEIELVVVSRR
jgi:hypothetical protein